MLDAASTLQEIEALKMTFSCSSIDEVAQDKDRVVPFSEVVHVFSETSRMLKQFENLVADVHRNPEDLSDCRSRNTSTVICST